MTKADLVEQVADAIRPRVTRKEYSLVIDTVLAAVKEAVARGEGIKLLGFGTFKVWHRKACTGRKPRTGKPIGVPSRDMPIFQLSRHLRSHIHRG